MSKAKDGRVMRLVHRLSVKTYSDSINVLPHLAFDREPGCWGYPGWDGEYYRIHFTFTPKSQEITR